MQIISFAPFDAHTSPIFAKLNLIKLPDLIKFPDLISFCNCLFIYKNFLSKSSSVYSNVFILTSNIHEQNTRSASHGFLRKPSCNTSKYGTNGFACSAIKSWIFAKKNL